MRINLGEFTIEELLEIKRLQEEIKTLVGEEKMYYNIKLHEILKEKVCFCCWGREYIEESEFDGYDRHTRTRIKCPKCSTGSMKYHNEKYIQEVIRGVKK